MVDLAEVQGAQHCRFKKFLQPHHIVLFNDFLIFRRSTRKILGFGDNL